MIQSRTVVASAVAAALAIGAGPARADQAHNADSFVESVGVCTHWTYRDTPYIGAYEDLKRLLGASGIRHVRDGFSDRIADLARLGIRTCVVTDPDVGTPEQIRDRIKSLNAAAQPAEVAVDAVEGPNEPDLFWVKFKKSYKGMGYKPDDEQQQGIIDGVAAFQKDLFTAMRADPATASIPVIGPSLGKTYDPGGGHPDPFAPDSLAEFVDWGNFHPYPYGGNPFSTPFAYDGIDKYYANGDFPSCNLDEFPYAFKTYGPPFGSRPMAATETGYPTDKNDTSELAQAKYVPRLFCEYFSKGIVRTYLYELVDEFDDANNREACFGLIHHDLSPKPAYTALRSLLKLLADRDAPSSFHAGSAPLAVEASVAREFNRVQYVHHLLLQRSDGDYYLLLWHEIADEDTSNTPHRQLTPPDMPTRVTFGAPVRRATVYRYDADWALQPRIVTFENGALDLDVPDTVTIVRFTVPGRRQ